MCVFECLAQLTFFRILLGYVRKKTSDTFLVSGLGYVLDKIHEMLLLEIVFEHHSMTILPFKCGREALP